MALLLKTALQEAGYAVDVVHTGERAVDAIADTYYDAIVLDVMLPGLNGFETCRRIRGRGIGAPNAGPRTRSVCASTARRAPTSRRPADDRLPARHCGRVSP